MLSILSDISKYTRANNHGELIFSKKGIQATRSVYKLTIKRNGFFLTIPSSSPYVEIRFECDQFTHICRVYDGLSTHLDQSRVYHPTDNIGYFYLSTTTGGLDFSAYRYLQYLRASIIGLYFDIESLDINNDTFTIILTAKSSVKGLDLDVTTRFIFSGSPTAWADDDTFCLHSQIAYTAPLYTSYRLYIRILIEGDERDTFDEVYTTYQTIGDIQPDGSVNFTFKNIPHVLRQYLSMPPIQDMYRIQLDRDIYKKFRVEYWETYMDNSVIVSTAVNSLDIATKYVALSALSERTLHCTEPIVPINNSGTTQYLAPGQPAWISFFIPEEFTTGMEQLSFSIRDNTGSVVHFGDWNTMLSYSNIFHVPVWFRVDSSTAITWLEVEIEYWTSAPISPSQYNYKKRFYLDRKYYPIQKWYYYLNSLGGIDTLRLCGESEDTLSMSYADYDVIQKRGDFMPLGQTQRHSAFATTRTKGFSGWIDRELVDQFRDFMMSRFVYEIDTEKLPTTVTGTPSSFTMRFSIRQTLERLLSHRVLIASKELAIPKGNDLPAFSLNIDRAYNDFGMLHTQTCDTLPALQEDYIEFVIETNSVFKGTIELHVSGMFANPSAIIDGLMAEGTLSPPMTFPSGAQVYNLVFDHTRTKTIRLQGNYTRVMHISLISSSTIDAEIRIVHSRFIELREFSLNYNIFTAPGVPISGFYVREARKFYMRHWTTLETLNICYVTEYDAEDILLSINNYRNAGSISSANFSVIDFTNNLIGGSSALTPAVGSVFNIIRAELTAKGILTLI